MTPIDLTDSLAKAGAPAFAQRLQAMLADRIEATGSTGRTSSQRRGRDSTAGGLWPSAGSITRSFQGCVVATMR